MKPELDKQLCERYPKIFADRYADMTVTAMCWGFECNDGWYNILDQLCCQIQHYTDWRQNQYNNAVNYNHALALAQAGDRTKLIEYYTFGDVVDERTLKNVEFEIACNQPRKLPELVQQVVASQVKEKYGMLRFYYDGGDDRITGMVDLAESMSSVTCEQCGAPGKVRIGGWVQTLCETHYQEKEIA
jgi:hypothetical protein